MAAAATCDIGCIVAIEGVSAIVALLAIIDRSDKVLLNGDIGHLPSLRCFTHAMTLIAAIRVVTMAKDIPKAVIRLLRPVIWCEIVANAARTDLAFRRMALKAIRVGVNPRLNGLAGPARDMTG